MQSRLINEFKTVSNIETSVLKLTKYYKFKHWGSFEFWWKMYGGFIRALKLEYLERPTFI